MRLPDLAILRLQDLARLEEEQARGAQQEAETLAHGLRFGQGTTLSSYIEQNVARAKLKMDILEAKADIFDLLRPDLPSVTP